MSQMTLPLTLDALSVSRISFVSFLVFLAVENVVSFTKTCFYRKRDSVTMHNYLEPFHTNIGYSLEQKFLTRYFSYRK